MFDDPYDRYVNVENEIINLKNNQLAAFQTLKKGLRHD